MSYRVVYVYKWSSIGDGILRIENQNSIFNITQNSASKLISGNYLIGWKKNLL